MPPKPDPSKMMNEEIARSFPARKVRLLMINPTDFMALFRKGLKIHTGFRIIDGIPADAQLVSVAYDPARSAVLLVVESAEYKPIERGAMPPIQPVKIKLNDKKKQ